MLLGENTQDTLHNQIKKAEDPFIPWDQLKIYLMELENFVNNNNLKDIINIIKKLVSGFKPSINIVDKVFSEKEKNFKKLSKIKIDKSQKDKKIVRIK